MKKMKEIHQEGRNMEVTWGLPLIDGMLRLAQKLDIEREYFEMMGLEKASIPKVA